jgi:hypothetical protein
MLDDDFVLANRQEADCVIAGLIGAGDRPDAGSGVDRGDLRVNDDGIL